MIDPNGLSYKHTFTSITGLEAPGLPSETMESLERVQRLSFLKFEDHESYALFQSLGASGGDGNNTGYSYNSENLGSFIRSYFYSLIIFHAGNPGGGTPNVNDVGTEGTEPPPEEKKFGSYKTWDRAGKGNKGYDKKLSKEEADFWFLMGNGEPIYVDNSYINWRGLSIPEGLKAGDKFSISTTDAFKYLPYETAATYGGTSFIVIDENTVEVLDQLYHYNYRDNNSLENMIRNFMTWWGLPTNGDQGKPYMIHFYNREIKIKE